MKEYRAVLLVRADHASPAPLTRFDLQAATQGVLVSLALPPFRLQTPFSNHQRTKSSIFFIRARYVRRPRTLTVLPLASKADV